MTGIKTGIDVFTMNGDQLGYKTQSMLPGENLSAGAFISFLQSPGELSDKKLVDTNTSSIKVGHERSAVETPNDRPVKKIDFDSKKIPVVKNIQSLNQIDADHIQENPVTSSTMEGLIDFATLNSDADENSDHLISLDDLLRLDMDATSQNIVNAETISLIERTDVSGMSEMMNPQTTFAPNEVNLATFAPNEVNLEDMLVDPEMQIETQSKSDLASSALSKPIEHKTTEITPQMTAMVAAPLLTTHSDVTETEVQDPDASVIEQNISELPQNNRRFQNLNDAKKDLTANDTSESLLTTPEDELAYQKLVDGFMEEQAALDAENLEKSQTTQKPMVQIQKPLILQHAEGHKPIYVSDLNKLIQQETQNPGTSSPLSVGAVNVEGGQSSNMSSDQNNKDQGSSSHRETNPFVGVSSKNSDASKLHKPQQFQQQFETQQRWEMMKNVVSEFQRNLSGNFREMRIPLRHERFGNLDVKFNFDRKGSVNAIFKTTSKEVVSMLAESRDAIEEVLRNADFNADRINVQFQYVGE